MLFRMLKIRKFVLLSRQEQQVFLRALYLLVYYRLGLKFRTLRELLQDLDKRCTLTGKTAASSIPVGRIAQLLATASRYVPFTTCLSKALAGMVVCHEFGYSTKLHIGVKSKQKQRISAHAWLTLSGEIVLCNLPDILQYTELSIERLEVFK